MRWGKRLGIGPWLSIGVFFSFLLLSVGPCWGQCVPGARYLKPGTTESGEYTGTFVPNSVIPSGSPGHSGSYAWVWYQSGTGPGCGYQINQGWTSTNLDLLCSGGIANIAYMRYVDYPGTCNLPYTGYALTFCYKWNTTEPYTHDFDCDGVIDNADQSVDDPLASGADVDGDGVDDAIDPWPGDVSLPGTGAIWKRYQDWSRKSDGKKLVIWTDGSGHYFSTWDGGGAIPNMNTVDLSLWRRNFSTDDDVGVTFSTAMGGTGVDPAPGTGSAVSQGDGLISGPIIDAINSEKGTLSEKLVDIYDRLGSLGSTEEEILGFINTKLGEIKTAIENQTPASMAGVESRIETTNSKLDDIKAALGESEVSTPDIPSSETGQVQDNSTVSDSENTNRLNAETGILSSFFDSWWGNNPIRTIVQGSGVTASGGSTFVLSTATFGSTTVNLAGLGDGLHTIGLIIVSLAGLSGIIVVLRN